MGILNLLLISSIPVVKVMLISGLGSYLALDHIDVLGDSARNHLNKLVFYVYNPALVFSNLAQTLTLDSILLLWFMPCNILLTFILGSALGYVLTKLTKAPTHLKGLIIGSCAAGNLGNLPLIIIPSLCHEKGSPFGDPDVCHSNGMAYASLSMAIGAVYLWSYVYNIVRVSSNGHSIVVDSTGNSTAEDAFENLLPCREIEETKVSIFTKIWQYLKMVSMKINMKAIFAPSTVGSIAGFVVGLVKPLQKLMIGSSAPLHVIDDSAYLLGEAAIPSLTLIIGANLLRGAPVLHLGHWRLNGSGIQHSIIIGIGAIRYLFLPLLGIIIVKGAIHLGLVQSDPLYQFVLLLQFALPPAMNIGTITQLFGAGESECSVILLWMYSLASIFLTLWSTFFMWLVSQ